MAIAYQPVTAPTPDLDAAPAVVAAHTGAGEASRRVTVDRPRRLWTAVRLVALLVATVVCVALVTAIVAGTALSRS